MTTQEYGSQGFNNDASPMTKSVQTSPDNLINPQGRKAKWLIALICLLILLITVLVTFAIINAMKKPETKKAADTTMAVLAAPARLENVQLMVSAQGEARPRTEIDLVPEVAGKVVYLSLIHI